MIAPTRLSQRELEIIGLIAQGYTNEAIAALLSISPHTVRSHVRNGMEKLDSRSRAHMVAQVMGGWSDYERTA